MMQDAYHTTSVVQMAVDLANTLRPIKGDDALETVEQLRDFLEAHAEVKPPGTLANQQTGPRHLTRTDLEKVRALRETLREVLEQARENPDRAVALINNGLRHSRATPVLRHEDDRWWIEVTSDSDHCSAHLAATMLSALASVIVTLGPARLGVCAGLACRATFVDLSRNGSKQYCTRACAHRASVAAYRSRRRPR